MRTRMFTTIAFTTAAFALPAFALASGIDTYFYVQDGRVKTGAITEANAGVPGGPDPFTPAVRVFEAEMGEDFPNFAEEPGFDSEISLFPGGVTSLGFRVIGALQEWDGSTFVPTSSTIDIGFLGNPIVSTPAGANDIVNGFTTNFLGDDTFHLHYDYTLQNPSSGIFLLSLSMYAPGSGLEPTVPFFYIFNNGMTEEETEVAVGYAETFLPSPGAGALLALTGLAALRRKRN